MRFLPVDLRSDTVTRPDAEMRRAMAEAEVGDDVFGEDPTVARLEAKAADALGAEASLFVPSGTMGNQIALHLHAAPGSEVLCEAACHHVLFEMGAMAALSGLQPRPVAAERGLLEAASVERAVNPELPYRSRSGAISVENTSMMAGGTVYRPDRLAPLVELARRHRLPIHLDGARLFNAAVALGIEAAELARGFDSVMISLSKGLGAPVGSILAGSRGFVAEARRVRKMLGGGMRQVGILAAAGEIALDRGPAWLAEDHANAARLAEGLRELAGVSVPEPPETNIVIARVAGDPASDPAAAFAARADEVAVRCVALDREHVRFVTHKDVPAEAIDQALDRLAEAVG